MGGTEIDGEAYRDKGPKGGVFCAGGVGVIRHIEEAQRLKEAGETLGRAELAERVIELVTKFALSPTGGSYVDAIALAGRLKAITAACKWDGYWSENAGLGFQDEYYGLRQRARAKKEKATAEAAQPKGGQ